MRLLQKARLLVGRTARYGHVRPTSSSATTSPRREGVVVGVFSSGGEGSEDDKTENAKAEERPTTVDDLTEAAREVNFASGGRLLKQLNFTKPLRLGSQRIFYGVDKNNESAVYSAVGLGRRLAGVDRREQLHKGKEAVRTAIATGVLALKSAGVTDVAVDFCGHPDAAAEGAVLSLHKYDKEKSQPRKEPPVNVRPLDDSSETRFGPLGDTWREGLVQAECQNLARTWMDTPANLMTPSVFCREALALFPQALIRDEPWIREQKMGAFLAVALGAKEPARFLEVHIEPKEKPVDDRPVVLVGKGVTFDTGGLSLKTPAGMVSMRGDMGGAATVLAAAYGVAQLPGRLRRRLIVLAPLTENMPSDRATRPGDIVRARNGKSIKIDNTDAEGRLVLADALAYADQFRPAAVVDVATLTGACHVALGAGATAVFTHDDRLFEGLQQAGVDAGDRFWRMPLFEHYLKEMHTASADLVNVSKASAGAGACTAAAFLSQFTRCPSWAHLDIAGVASLDAANAQTPYIRGVMSGRPTRALIKWLLKLQ